MLALEERPPREHLPEQEVLRFAGGRVELVGLVDQPAGKPLRQRVVFQQLALEVLLLGFHVALSDSLSYVLRAALEILPTGLWACYQFRVSPQPSRAP